MKTWIQNTKVARKTWIILPLIGAMVADQRVSVAQATYKHGEWEPDVYINKGKTFKLHPLPPQKPTPWTEMTTPFGAYGDAYDGVGPAPDYWPWANNIRDPARSYMVGTTRSHVKWRPNYGNTQADTVFYVREESLAFAAGMSNPTLTAKNGLGVVGTQTWSSPNNWFEATANTHKVRRIKNPQRKAYMKLDTRSLKAESFVGAAGRPQAQSGAWAKVNIFYKVKPVKFEIFSPDTEENFYKPTDGSTTPVPWMEKPSGALKDDWPNRNVCDRHNIDTVLTWIPENFPNPSNTECKNPAGWYGAATFAVDQNAFGSPTYDWSIAGAGILPECDFVTGGWGGQISNESRVESQHGGLMKMPWYYFGKDPGVFNSEIKVIASDTDPINTSIATGIFKVKWHLPYEITEELPTYHWKLPGEVVGTQSNPTTGFISVEDSSRTFSITNFAEGLGTLVGLIPLPQAKAASTADKLIKAVEIAASLGQIIGGAADLDFEYGGTPLQPANNDQTLWDNFRGSYETSPSAFAKNFEGDPAHLNLHDANTASLYGLYNVTLRRSIYGHRQWWLADKYGKHGFESDGWVPYHDKIDLVQVEPYYKPKAEMPGVDPNPPLVDGNPVSVSPGTMNPVQVFTPAPPPPGN